MNSDLKWKDVNCLYAIIAIVTLRARRVWFNRSRTFKEENYSLLNKIVRLSETLIPDVLYLANRVSLGKRGPIAVNKIVLPAI